MDKSKRYVQINRPGQSQRRSVNFGEHPDYRIHEIEPKSETRGIFFFLMLVLLGGGLFYWRQSTVDLYERKLKLEREAHSAQIKEFETKLSRLTEPVLKDIPVADLPLVFERSSPEGTVLSDEAPKILGSTVADDHIRTIAQERGYKHRPEANAQLAIVDGFQLQVEAAKAWIELKTAAQKDGIYLAINSAYRSVDEQRILFLQRLGSLGATNAQIASGQFDEKLVETFKITSPPGYSRHHTGYVVDLADSKNAGKFETTPAFAWMSANNYLNARKYGWVPSYPVGAAQQGPEPEAWEYAYVGLQALAQ